MGGGLFAACRRGMRGDDRAVTEPNWSVPTTINAATLTTASWITLTQIAYRLALGFNEREVAREIGVTQKVVAARLDDLRDELAG
jgi:hypothetical protein